MSVYSPRGFCDWGCLGSLTLDGQGLSCAAWDTPNPMKLLAAHAVRGANTVIPGMFGQRGNPHRLDQAEFDLAFLINGDVDQYGNPHPDPWRGLEINLNTLWTNIFQPVTPPASTRAAQMLTVNGARLFANVQVEPLHFANDIEDPHYVEAVIHMTVVSGRFHPLIE